MTIEKASALQENITKEAIALLRLLGQSADTAPYEKTVMLIARAWGISDEDTQVRLDLIRMEKEIPDGYAEDPEEQTYPEEQLPINATGMETLNNIWGLFETAVQLDSVEERNDLYHTATELAESQTLLDWIIQTEKEVSAHTGGKGVMSLDWAIRKLNGVIPHPDSPMVDYEHMPIAIAWQTVKRELYKPTGSPREASAHD